jgi:hypothetical protein
MKNVLRTRLPEPRDVFVPDQKEVDRRRNGLRIESVNQSSILVTKAVMVFEPR